MYCQWWFCIAISCLLLLLLPLVFDSLPSLFLEEKKLYSINFDFMNYAFLSWLTQWNFYQRNKTILMVEMLPRLLCQRHNKSMSWVLNKTWLSAFTQHQFHHHTIALIFAHTQNFDLAVREKTKPNQTLGLPWQRVRNTNMKALTNTYKNFCEDT